MGGQRAAIDPENHPTSGGVRVVDARFREVVTGGGSDAPIPGPDQYLALVFRCREEILFEKVGQFGLVPFTRRLTRGMPLPPTVDFDNFQNWVDQFLVEMGIDSDEEGITVLFQTEALTLRPMQNINFTLATIDVPERHFSALRSRLDAPTVSASEVMQQVNANLFYGLIAAGYRVPAI